MGGGGSIDQKRHKSKRTDTVSNLVWALQEHSAWEENAIEHGIMDRLKEEDDRYHELAAHYVLLHHLIQQLGALSVDNCKAFLHVQQLQRKLKTYCRPYDKLEAEKRLQTVEESFSRGLGSYDNARGAAVWLKEQCDLLFEQLTLEREIIEQKEALPELPKTLKLRTERLQRRFDEHKRQLLAVAMHYHDRNFSGHIEPEDMPALTASLFNVIDVNKDHRVSADELDKAVTGLDKRLLEAGKRLEQLQLDAAELDMQLAALPQRDSEASRTEREMTQVKIVRAREALEKGKHVQDVVRHNRESIAYHFEHDGFINDMHKKLSDIQAQPLLKILEGLLVDATARDEVLKIGLFDTDIKVSPASSGSSIGFSLGGGCAGGAGHGYEAARKGAGVHEEEREEKEQAHETGGQGVAVDEGAEEPTIDPEPAAESVPEPVSETAELLPPAGPAHSKDEPGKKARSKGRGRPKEREELKRHAEAAMKADLD